MPAPALLGFSGLLGSAADASAPEGEIRVDAPSGAIVHQGSSCDVPLQVVTDGPCGVRITAAAATGDPGLTWSLPLPTALPPGRATALTARVMAASNAAPGGTLVRIRLDFMRTAKGIERTAGSQTAAIFVYVVPHSGPVHAGPAAAG